jgi:hypothetical protein
MKPIRSNSQKETCSPISSNCIVWQGPDLPCISLCNGDSISDVTYKLAEEVCKLKSDLGVSDLDLTCLVQVCQTTPEPTKTLANILNLLINKVCCLSDIVKNIPDPGTPYSEPTLDLAPCLIYTTGTGTKVTKLILNQYVQRIATFLCEVNTTVIQNTADIAVLQGKVRDLENAPDPIPQIDSCLLDAIADVDAVVEELETQFCEYKDVFGPVSDFNTAIGRQCANLNTERQLATGDPMTNLGGWKTTVQNFAQSINNLWLTVCDIRAAVSLIQSTCCQVSCDDIVVDFDYTWIDESTINAFFTPKTNVPAGFWDCNEAQGQTFRITDANGAEKLVYIPFRKENPSDTSGVLTNNTWITGGYPISLTPSALNTSTTLTINSNLCFTTGDVNCIKCFTKTIAPYINTDCCQISSSTVNTIIYQVCIDNVTTTTTSNQS